LITLTQNLSLNCDCAYAVFKSGLLMKMKRALAIPLLRNKGFGAIPILYLKSIAIPILVPIPILTLLVE